MSDKTSPVPAGKKAPAKRDPDLIDAIAADIGAELAHYIRTMYPQAVEAASSTFLTSVRNHTRTQVEAMLRGPQDEAEIRKRLEERARHRRRVARGHDTAWEQQPVEAAIAYAKGDEIDG